MITFMVMSQDILKKQYNKIKKNKRLCQQVLIKILWKIKKYYYTEVAQLF